MATTNESSSSVTTGPSLKKPDEKTSCTRGRKINQKPREDERREQMRDLFGHANTIQSTNYNSRKFTDIKDVCTAVSGKQILLRGRVAARRTKGRIGFLLLRQGADSVQCILMSPLPTEMIRFLGDIPEESIVDVEGLVVTAPQPVTSTTAFEVEIHVQKLFVVSVADVLPFSLLDATRPQISEDEEGFSSLISIGTRLDTRWLDLRTRSSNAIFKIQSFVGHYFRQFLIGNDFTEVHTPKLCLSDPFGNDNSPFKIDYFGRVCASLATSTITFRQMCVQGDLTKVFEIGPVFSHHCGRTHRHLSEYISMDVEMTLTEHYYEILTVAESVLLNIFTQLSTHTSVLEAVAAQYPSEKLVFQLCEATYHALGVRLDVNDENSNTASSAASKCLHAETTSNRILRLPFKSCIDLLNGHRNCPTNRKATPLLMENILSVNDDITVTNQHTLGILVKDRYGVDVFVMTGIPSKQCPCYVMPSASNEDSANAFRIYVRGEEICFGSQHIHDINLLSERLTSLNVKIGPSLVTYMNSLSLGAWPHGGFSIGLERLVMAILGLRNIRLASLFPRDPNRITP